jgi:hypothetical protein
VHGLVPSPPFCTVWVLCTALRNDCLTRHVQRNENEHIRGGRGCESRGYPVTHRLDIGRRTAKTCTAMGYCTSRYTNSPTQVESTVSMHVSTAGRNWQHRQRAYHVSHGRWRNRTGNHPDGSLCRPGSLFITRIFHVLGTQHYTPCASTLYLLIFCTYSYDTLLTVNLTKCTWIF